MIEILADMLEELQEHVESIDMANGKFVNVYSVIVFIHFLKFHGVLVYTCHIFHYLLYELFYTLYRPTLGLDLHCLYGLVIDIVMIIISAFFYF